jgi:hypothetical protein
MLQNKLAHRMRPQMTSTPIMDVLSNDGNDEGILATNISSHLKLVRCQHTKHKPQSIAVTQSRQQ